MNKIATYNFLFLIIIYFTLEYLYKYAISDSFLSLGFYYEKNQSLLSYPFKLSLFFCFYLSLNFNDQFSKLTSNAFLIFGLIPSFIIYENMHHNSSIYLSHLFFYLFLTLSLKFFSLKFKFKTNINYESIFRYLFVVLIILTLPYILIYKFDFNVSQILFEDVYVARDNQIQKSNFYTNYSYSFISRFLIPILIIFFISKKKNFLVLCCISLFFYFFLIGGHKSILFSLFYIYVIYKYRNKDVTSVFLISILILLLLTYISFNLDYNILSSFFLRRIIFFPSLLDVYYFDYFNNNFIYWSNSILSSFFDYNLYNNPSNIIGFKYFESWEMSANNGLVSNGFMNFGYIGIFINTIIVSIYFVLFKSLIIDKKFLGIILGLTFSFLSSGTLVVLFSHGAILLFLLFILVRK